MLYQIRVLLASLIIMLSSCSYKDNTDDCDSSQPLSPTADFVATGVMVATVDSHKQKFNFFWEQADKHYKIGVLGPLGIPLAEVNGNELNAQIKITNEEENYNLKEFMLARLGYYINPVTLLTVLLGAGNGASGITVTAISCGCVDNYRVPNKLALQLSKSGVTLDLKITSWQL